MRIVVASNGLDVAPSFSQCENFNYYTTMSCEIVASQNIPAQGLTPEGYAALMEDMEVTALVCNEMGAMAKSAFEAHDITVIDDQTGNAFQAAEQAVNMMGCRIEEDQFPDSDD